MVLVSGATARRGLRHYYEASTRRFLALGGSGGALAIHRGLWGAGVTDAEAAAGHINRLVVARLAALEVAPPAQVADLGCGVGGSLLHLARVWPEARLEGLTLSPVQADLAAGFARSRGVAVRVRVHCADFLDPPAAGPGQAVPADLLLAIESHVHAPDAAAFLQAARDRLRPGGHLVIVDDMLARPEATLTDTERRLLATFRRGWHLGHVPCPGALRNQAGALGLECRADDDLSGMLRLDRLRDRLLTGVAPLADALGLGRWPLWSNMIGGNALTQLHRRGALCYRMMVFRHREAG